MNVKVTEIVTANILKALEAGTKPWVKPWQAGLAMPRNLHTGKRYSGVNVLNLWGMADDQGYASPYWLTFKQALERGGNVKKGEKGTPVLWASKVNGKEDPNKRPGEISAKDLEDRFAWRYFTAFNVEQCDGIEYPKPNGHKPLDFNPIPEAQRLVEASGAKIKHENQHRACFSPAMDRILMPLPSLFHSTEGYYATLLHELTHWTGGEKRLNRQFGKRFGDQAYAFEELVAELGSAFLSSELGIKADIENHASYIDHWHSLLKQRPGAMIEAASKASKAFEYLLDLAGTSYGSDSLEAA